MIAAFNRSFKFIKRSIKITITMADKIIANTSYTRTVSKKKATIEKYWRIYINHKFVIRHSRPTV